MVEMHT